MITFRRPTRGRLFDACFRSARAVALAAALAIGTGVSGAHAGLLHGAVAVSDGGSPALGPSNGSRAVAAGPDGFIYVAYQDNATNEVRVARSTDRGQSFEPSIAAFAGPNAIAGSEMAVSSVGVVYVTAVQNTGEITVSRSFDGGATFTSQTAGFAASLTAGIHIATDGHRVYTAAAGNGGVDVYSSDDDGATFTLTPVGMSIAFFSLLVDPVDGDVVVAADTPGFHVRVSSDHGATFAAEQNPPGTDYYSAWTISSSPAGSYLLVAGSNLGGALSTAAKIDLDTYGATDLPAFAVTGTPQSRSIFADSCGNVVDSYRSDSAGAGAFHVSNDLGNSFGVEHVVAGSSSQSVTINPSQGDILFAYQSGGAIYLDTYSDEVPAECYQPSINVISLDFGALDIGETSAPQNVVLTNDGTSSVQINAINATGDFAGLGGACVGALAPTASCTIPVTFTPTAVGIRLGQLQVLTDTVVRTVALRGSGLDYALDVVVDGEGSVSAAASPVPDSGSIDTCTSAGGSNCSARYPRDAVVVLEAAPAAGSHFVGWSGDAACAGGAVTLDADHACTATFEQNEISGGVGGLAGDGFVLHLAYDSGSEDLAVASGTTAFSFASAIPSGETYSVAVGTQPGNPNQTCSVTNGSGTMPAGTVNNVIVICAGDLYTVGGSVGGLDAPGLVLQLNGGNDLPVNSGDTSFVFPSALANGSSYVVSIAQQPADRLCSVSNGSGSIDDANVVNVSVDCVALAPNTINGGVGGLTGSGLVLHLDYGVGSENLPVAAGATSFSFVSNVPAGAGYVVSVGTQPVSPGQTCSVSNGSGTMPAGSVGNVLVLCTSNAYTVGGSVAGLTGVGLILQLNGGNDLALTSGSSSFVFASPIAGGSTYVVTVSQQPAGQTCSVANAGGVVGDADIDNVSVTCQTAQPQLQLVIGDGHDYARYGATVDYLVTLTNSGNATATGVTISAAYSAALVSANSTWICIAGGEGTLCAVNGSGPFADTVNLPAGQSVSWLVSVPVSFTTVEPTIELDVSAGGATPVSDIDTLVFLRDGFDTSYGNGTDGAIGTAAVAAILAGDEIKSFTLPESDGSLIDDVLVLPNHGADILVQRASLGGAEYVRLLQRHAGAEDSATRWERVATGATLTVATIEASATDRLVLLQGAADALSLALTH